MDTALSTYTCTGLTSGVVMNVPRIMLSTSQGPGPRNFSRSTEANAASSRGTTAPAIMPSWRAKARRTASSSAGVKSWFGGTAGAGVLVGALGTFTGLPWAWSAFAR